jgi:hypothetical protein
MQRTASVVYALTIPWMLSTSCSIGVGGVGTANTREDRRTKDVHFKRELNGDIFVLSDGLVNRDLGKI